LSDPGGERQAADAATGPRREAAVQGAIIAFVVATGVHVRDGVGV
jgi:hypothetical protein